MAQNNATAEAPNRGSHLLGLRYQTAQFYALSVFTVIVPCLFLTAYAS